MALRATHRGHLGLAPAADLLARVRVSLQDGCDVVEGAALETHLPGAP